MDIKDLKKEDGIKHQRKDEKKVILGLLNSIFKTDIDSIEDLENFLQQVIEVSAAILSAQSSKLVLFNVEKSIDFSSMEDSEEIFLTGHSLSIPLALRGLDHPMGYIEVRNRKNGESFDFKDAISLLMIGRQATLKIENDLFYRGIYENMIEMLKSMVNIIETRDPYIRSHSSRVTNYALQIAKDLKLSVQEMDVMRIACLLHDIGKIGIPDAILTKKGHLTDDEWDRIRKHTLIGENIVKPLGFLAQEGEIIRTHHECFNGSGYPNGLKGEDIPLSARIIAVADSFDAMTSHRPYRRAKSPKESLDEIEQLQSIKYDPWVVQSFKKYFY